MTASPDGQGLALADVDRAVAAWNEAWAAFPETIDVSNVEAVRRIAMRAALRARSREQTDGAGREWTTTPSIPASAKWCQPGDRQDERIFILRYDDTDMGDCVFTDEGEAREAWAKATLSWNCYLLASLPVVAELEAAPPLVAPGGISEDVLARAICVAAGGDPDRITALSVRGPHPRRWRAYLLQARACLALVAPVLARCERERDAWKVTAQAEAEIGKERERRVEELTRDLERVRGALEPFAAPGDWLIDSEAFVVTFNNETWGIKYNDFRRAAAAIRARSTQAEGRPYTQAEPHDG